tara:strand:+ start:819 stop:1241 length:423 start_codon:yes stop_codon:yes gene_type:complete
MGLHYSQRTYYNDPEKNNEFIRIYGCHVYCKHGQPSYVKCHKCFDETRDKYRKKDHFGTDSFWEFFRRMFEDKTEEEEEVSVNVSDKPDIFKPLKKSSSFDELKKEYRKLSKVHHPDKGGDHNIMVRLNNLYEKLRDRFI